MNISFVLLAFTASMGLLHGCELSARDQVLLIDHDLESRLPGDESAHGLAGERIECATLAPLVFVRRPKAGYAYILDRRRIFHPWSSTGTARDGELTRVIRVYLEQYSSTGRWAWWKEYGTAPLSVPTLSSDLNLEWRELQLIRPEQFDLAKQQQLSSEHEEFLRRLMRERIRVYMNANGYSDAQLLGVRYSTLYQYTGNAQVVVQIMRSTKQEDLSFTLPVNPSSAPFVGYPTPP
jgi:hypothetical protein